MMFKQLPTMISNISQLGDAANKLKAINFSVVGLNSGNIDAYRNAISLLSKEQATLLLSSKGLNQAQIDLILSNKEVTASEIAEATATASTVKSKALLTAEQQKQLLTSGAITSEKLAEIAATLGLETAENGSLVAKKALNVETVKQQLTSMGIVGSTQAQIVSMLGLTTAETGAATAGNVLTGVMARLSLAMSANPIGALVTVIGLAITAVWGLSKAFDALTDSDEEIDERVDSLIDKYNEAKNKADENANTVESLASEYEKLSKGVNNLGENVSLTSDEYDRYNQIVNQIADMFPDLISGYTEEGNAILSLKGNVEGLRDAYKEAQQEAYNLLIAKGEDSDGEDIVKAYKNLSELDFWDTNNVVGEDFTTTAKRDVTKRIIEISKNLDTAPEEYDKLAKDVFDTYGDKGYNLLKEMGLPAITDRFSKTTGITVDDLKSTRATVQSYYQGYQAEISNRLKNVDTLANAYLLTNEDYSNLDNQSKTAASLLVNNLTEDIADQFSTKEDVGAYVANIVSQIKDNPDLNEALIGLFTTDLSDANAATIVDDYVKEISQYFNEDPIEIKTRLGFDNLESQKEASQDAQKLADTYRKTINRFPTNESITSQDVADSKAAVQEEYDKIHNWELDSYADQIKDGTIQSKYGNVDMDNRQIIDWNLDNIEKWKDQLSDIKYYDKNGNFIDSYYDQLKESAEKGESNIDTVFGDMMDHIEGYGDISSLAFSHVVNNDDGTFEFLGQKTAEEYIYGILDEAKKDGDLSIDHILELDKQGDKNAEIYDAQGKKIGQSYIHGIIAGFNSNSEDISKLMHMSGKYGGVQIAQRDERKVESQYGNNEQNKIKNFLDENGISDNQELLDEFNQVTEGITNADEAMLKWKIHQEQAAESFSTAWNDLKTLSESSDDSTDKEDKAAKALYKSLSDLADKGELTVDTFRKVDGAENYFDSLGISAGQAVNQINQLSDKNSQVSAMRKNIKAISEALESKQTDGFATADDFAGFDATIKGLNSWKEFTTLLGDAKSSIGDIYYDDNNHAYRFRVDSGVYSWQVLTDTDVTKALSDSADAISKANATEKKLTTDYKTWSDTSSEIEQTKNGILQTVKDTYAESATVTDLSNNLKTNYSTTKDMNSAIKEKADEITLAVSETYSTKKTVEENLATSKSYADGVGSKTLESAKSDATSKANQAKSLDG